MLSLGLKKIEEEKIICKVVYGDLIKPGKALNLPGANYSAEVLTLKDQENLKHAIETGWDFVSPSFINSKDSAQEIKDFINNHGGENKMKIIAKIEDQKGVDNIDTILEIVDGVMIARGGLGVEIGLESVPIVQRLLTKKCNQVGKPVITATHMLESMVENPRPTRAEASDVATAVLLGTDAVMLSGESSIGNFPVNAVKFLASTSAIAEQNYKSAIIEKRGHGSTTGDALSKAAANICFEMQDEINSVIVVSKSGTTARLLSRHLIPQPIYLFTSNDFYVRTALLTKNIIDAFAFEGIRHGSEDYDRDHAVQIIMDLAKKNNLIQPSQKILFIGKTPIDRYGYFPNLFEILEVQ